MFKNTQGRLTRIYSGLLILFLILFIVIVYSVLYVVILKNEEHELQTLVNQEARFIENDLWENNKGDLRGFQNQEVVFAGVNQFFYYVVDSNGEMLMGSETNPRLRPDLLRLVSAGFRKGNEVRQETLQVRNFPNGGRRGEFHSPNEDQDVRLIIASQSLYYKGQFVGELYVGKDISFIYQLFSWLIIIFAVLGILFIGIALIISVKMSERAMIPISSAFKRQREFVGDASHELRTPLSVLLSSIDAMEMTIELEKGGMIAKLLTNMRQEVKRMTHLVTDLLTLARSDSNTIELRTEVFDYRPLAEKALESVQPLAAAKQIKLGLSSPSSLQVAADHERLSQLLYILLDNAIKYTQSGGEVKLGLSKKGNDLYIVVQDTGIGIKKEDLGKIFERFYRVDKSRSRQAGGHGLGLSIAKWIIDTHKGTIKVTSAVGKGSTFEVRVPDTNK
ncbi:GHKL domain-containing protein [Bacillus sp. S3]|uniref:sensor histidine kinase n=1 Tax=Bacillus sp. S3 TaxID=486398 RepID=UPI0011890546|nr:ATP-binding protein [Bacillus sp. S3]QCJ41036.1 GHKL domain-containing protein [Bacillus sp. S3]